MTFIKWRFRSAIGFFNDSYFAHDSAERQSGVAAVAAVLFASSEMITPTARDDLFISALPSFNVCRKACILPLLTASPSVHAKFAHDGFP